MSKKTRNIIIVGVVLLAVVLAAVFGNRKETPKVKIEKIGYKKITESVAASGKIQPEVDVKITSQVSGQIVELPVKEGDFVEKGQILLKINPDLYQAALSRAQAALNSSKSGLANSKARLVQSRASLHANELSYNRSKILSENGAISQAEWDNVQSKFAISNAELESAQENVKAAEYAIMSSRATVSEANENLRRTTILAPKSGTITALAKELGESVLGNQMMAGEVIMKVSDLKTMEVDVEVNESDIIKVQLGDSAVIEVDSYGDNTFMGIVTEIGNTALNSMGGASSMDAVTNFSVKIRIDEKTYRNIKSPEGASPFRPGMSATVEIISNSKDHVLAVPVKAVTTRIDTASVDHYKYISKADKKKSDPFIVAFVLNSSNKAELRIIKTGIQDLDYYEVLEGLDEGDEIIVGPFKMVSKKLQNGQKVEVEKEKKSKDKDEE